MTYTIERTKGEVALEDLITLAVHMYSSRGALVVCGALVRTHKHDPLDRSVSV